MKIVLTGGGTAGHVIPHLALLNDFKKAFDDIFYIGSKSGMEKEIIKNENISYYEVTTVKLNRKLSLSNLFIPFKLIKGIQEAKKILKKLEPDIIFSKGGFVSVPVCLAAKKLSIPVVLHESDMTLGLANKICARYSQKVLTSFNLTAKTIKNNKGVYTGAPIRAKLYNGNKQKGLLDIGFSGQRPILLVIGGSSGAVAINEVLRKSLGSLQKYDIIHVTGKGNIVEFNIKNYKQIEFLEKIEDVFAAADVVVSRAGSNAITEFLALKKPALLIPLPKASSRGDQILNAEYFKSKNYSLVLLQKDLNVDTFTNKIFELERKKQVLTSNLERANCIDGTKNIFNEILASAIACK